MIFIRILLLSAGILLGFGFGFGFGWIWLDFDSIWVDFGLDFGPL